MSFLGKLARGVATGLGNYYGEVAKSEEEDRKAQILAARERALASVNHQNRMDEIHATGMESRATDNNQAVNRVAGEIAVLGPKTDSALRVERDRREGEYQVWKAKNKTEFGQKLTEVQLRERFETERNNANIAAGDRRNAADNQTTRDTHPILVGETPSGEPVASFAPNATTRQVTMRGGRSKHTGSGDDDYGDTSGGIRPTAPQAPTAPDARFLTRYSNATEDRYPSLYNNGQKIPLDEAWKRYQGAQ